MNIEHRRLLIFNYLKRSGETSRTISEIYDFVKSNNVSIDRKTVARDMDFFQDDPSNGIIRTGERPALRNENMKFSY